MTEEQKELFEKHTDFVHEFQTMTDGCIFYSSSKMEARMMLDAMEE